MFVRFEKIKMLSGLIVFIVFLFILLIPSIIAYKRKLKRRFACLCINIIFGWTVIFWILLLTWSMLTSAVEG